MSTPYNGPMCGLKCEMAAYKAPTTGMRHKSFRYSNPYNGLCAAPKGTKTAASLLRKPAQMVPSTGRPGGFARKFWNVNSYNGLGAAFHASRCDPNAGPNCV